MEKTSSRGSGNTHENLENVPHKGRHGSLAGLGHTDNFAAAFENPLGNRTREELLGDVEAFCLKYDMMDHIEDFRKGAIVAQNPQEAATMPELTGEEKAVIDRETSHRWSQPFTLYWLCVMCSLA